MGTCAGVEILYPNLFKKSLETPLRNHHEKHWKQIPEMEEVLVQLPSRELQPFSGIRVTPRLVE